MPVHPGGPRLYRSIKFEHLAAGAGGGGRASNVALNLTPFVDMMTILVTFLLMVFSASGEILQAQKGLELPQAARAQALQQAPIVIISRTEIVVIIQESDSAMPRTLAIASVDSVLQDQSPTWKIDSLHEVLKAAYDDIHNNRIPTGRGYDKEQIAACDREKQGLPPIEGKPLCPDGLAIVQADKETDARVINMVVNTARGAGFEKLLFAVKKIK